MRVTLKRGNLTEELPPSDYSVSVSVGHFLSSRLMWKGPAFPKKVAEQAKENKLINCILPWFLLEQASLVMGCKL